MTSSPTIEAQVAELQQASAGRLPADVSAAFAAEQRALAEAGAPAGMPAVVVFYRGAWCPFCNLTLRAYQQDLVPALAERGAALIAVSPQRPDGSLSMQEANDLTFEALSDPGNQIAGKLGIVTAPADDVRAAQLTLGLDLTERNADGTTALPMPTVVVTDAAGVIRWIDVHPNYTTRTEVSEILAAVDALG
jgi:peroxiredoxin